MNEMSASLIEWFSERPKWLQIAAIRLHQQHILTDQDINELAQLCQREADGEEIETAESLTSITFTNESTGVLRLCSISEVKGVNALSPRDPLEFGNNNIVIVYGQNGSGKTGYIRLLKHICNARHKGDLHGNVYAKNTDPQSACIIYKKDDQTQTYNWSGDNACDDLRSVDIYDTSFGRIFVDSEDELSYEPPLLEFFSSLINVCDQVASILKSEVNKQPSKKPSFPTSIKSTPEGSWYDLLNAKTTVQEINKYCSFDKPDAQELEALQKRVSEKSPEEKAKELRRQIQQIGNLVSETQGHIKQLSLDNVQKIKNAKQDVENKKTASKAAAKLVFFGSELEGIGSDTWKLLWEAARNYSVEIAYEGIDYPYTSEGARCVLCHQELSREAKRRMISFEEFVKGETQKAAILAEEKYQAMLKAVNQLPSSDILNARIVGSNLTSDEFIKDVSAFYAKLQDRRDQLFACEYEVLMSKPLITPNWVEEISSHSKKLNTDASKYDNDAKIDNRSELKKAIARLESKKWLSENRQAIEKEIERLKLHQRIAKAIDSTNTRVLSAKKGALAELLITEAFVKRFNEELVALGAAQVRVELIQPTIRKGKVLHKIQLRDASHNKLHDILSEGENRIVSIASFIADTTGKTGHSTVLFDDPISSLDAYYEKKVVQRLIRLSQNTQVIVFTHRLSLVFSLQNHAKKVGISTDTLCISAESWGTGQPRGVPIWAETPKGALNRILNEYIPKAKKKLKESGKEAYEQDVKSISSEARILFERIVELELIAGVVQRFREEVRTKNIIFELSKITKEDCAYIDGLMTKYSVFEHSQSIEIPVEPPCPDELENDFEELKDWLEEFKNRSAEN